MFLVSVTFSFNSTDITKWIPPRYYCYSDQICNSDSKDLPYTLCTDDYAVFECDLNNET